MNYSRRLQSEYKRYKENKIEGITMEPEELSLLEWNCTITAPENSPYENRIFKVKLILPTDYPMHPPKAYFQTPIFHPNIHFVSGEVCLDILKSKWTPVWNLESVCLAIQVLMSEPDPSSPLNCDAGSLFLFFLNIANILRCHDIAAYNSLARLLSQ